MEATKIEKKKLDDAHFAVAELAIAAIQNGLATLQRSPFTCRKAGQSPFLRELVIPFGASGYVALFEISGPDTVVIAAVRHQREDDYHYLCRTPALIDTASHPRHFDTCVRPGAPGCRRPRCNGFHQSPSNRRCHRTP